MDDCYIRFTSIELTSSSIYNYLLKHHDTVGDIYVIISDSINDNYITIISSIYPVQFVKPEEFSKILSTRESYMIDITGYKAGLLANTNMGTNNKIAIVMYVYYSEFVTEMLNRIMKFNNNSKYDIDVHMYICRDTGFSHVKKILYEHPINNEELTVYTYPLSNLGRDIMSMLKFIKSKKYQNYAAVCKIHTKNTTYLDTDWRTRYLDSLFVDNNDNINDLINITRPIIQSVKRYDITERYDHGNPNYDSITTLMEKLGKALPPGYRYNYNAGTMFWCNNKYCDKLYRMIDHIDLDTLFEPEPIPGDGTIAHAWERSFFII